MSRYQAPQGFKFDSQTGLYYSCILAADMAGNQSQVVTWFNAESGQYSQNVYPLSAQYQRSVSPQVNRSASPSINSPVSTQAKRPAPPPIHRGEFRGTAGNVSKASGYSSANRRQIITSELRDKGKVAMGRASEGIKGATAGISAQMAENARRNAKQEGLAYIAVDKNGNQTEPHFFRKLFYAAKRFINNAPWWLILAVVGVFFIIDVIRTLIWGFDVQQFFPLILIFLFPAIPCTIMHFRDMKHKYGVKFKETIPTIPLALCGMLSVFPAVCLSFSLPLILLFEGPAPLSVFLWYLCMALASFFMYLIVKRRFKKYNLPVFELRMTMVLLSLISVIAGIAALWAIAVVMIIALVLFLIPMLLDASATPSTSTTSTYETHTEGYDQWGNKVYDSRYDGDFDTWANS